MRLKSVFVHSRGGGLLLASVVLLLTPPVASRSHAEEPHTIVNPYLAAARTAGVPLELLVAVAGAESGFHPWALNLDGRSVYCKSQADARRLLVSAKNPDIGLMQINWPIWGPKLGLSKQEMLDPLTNLIVGARILRASLDRSGSLWQRLGSYHSSRPAARRRYIRRVYEGYIHYMRRSRARLNAQASGN